MTLSSNPVGASGGADAPMTDVAAICADTVESDSDDYKHTFYGILNKQGQFWTPIPFHDEKAASDYLARYAVGSNAGMKRTHKIVPVRIRLTALMKDKAL